MLLKEKRLERGLTQTALMDAGVTAPTIIGIERGKIWPNKSTRQKIEAMIGKVDWPATRLRGFDTDGKGADSGVLFALSQYFFGSTVGSSKDKLKFLKGVLKAFEQTIEN